MTIRRSSYWNMREVSYYVELPLATPKDSDGAQQEEHGQEYLLVPTAYHPNVPAAFSLIIRSHPALGLQLDPEPFRDRFTHDVSIEGLWRGASGGMVGGGAPSTKTFMDNPQFVLSCASAVGGTAAGAAASAVSVSGGDAVPRGERQVGPGSACCSGNQTKEDDDAVTTYITLRLVEEVKKRARGSPAWTERVERVPKLGVVVLRPGGDDTAAAASDTDTAAAAAVVDPRCRLDKKPPRGWIVAQVRRTALEVSVALPRDWAASHDGGGGARPLLVIPYITPRSRSSSSGIGKNMKFELRALSSEPLDGQLALEPAAMGLGGSGGGAAASGPFAGKPMLGGGASRSKGRRAR